MFDNIGGRVMALLAPARCHWCGAAGAGVACEGCREALPWNEPACPTCALPLAVRDSACARCLGRPPPQDRAWAAFRYAEPVARQIVRLKFRARLAPADVLGALMAGRLARRPAPLPELLLPVPLHPQRLRRRGYNQALELARALARRLPLRLCASAARRVRPTGEQTRLDAAQRRRNVRGAFAVDAEVRGRHVAVLDDVITTGATIEELARAARAAGAAQVEVWAAARADAAPRP